MTLVVLGADDELVDANHAARTLGIDVGRDLKWTDILSVADRIYHETNIRPILTACGSLDQVAVTLRTGAGRFEGFVAYQVLEDHRTLIAFTPAEERRRYEEQLRAARDQAIAASERLACLAEMSAALVRATQIGDVKRTVSEAGPGVLGLKRLSLWLHTQDGLPIESGFLEGPSDCVADEVIRKGCQFVAGDRQYVPVAVDGRILAVLELSPPAEAAQSELLGSVVEQIGAAISRVLTTELTISQATKLSLTDPLTKLPNRRYAERELELRAGQHSAYTLALVDVDHFKVINDTYGHDVGDEVLIAIASQLRSSLRACDVLARWGGEEFLVVLETPSLEVARTLCERLRQQVCEHPVPTSQEPLSVTISSGFTIARPGEPPIDALRRADTALYEAKRAGRNCTIAAD